MHSVVRVFLFGLLLLFTFRLSAQGTISFPKSAHHHECRHAEIPPLYFRHSISHKKKEWNIRLSWHIESDSRATSFKLYRDGKLLKTISAWQGPFRFLGPYHYDDEKRDIYVQYKYALVALNAYRHIVALAKSKVRIVDCVPRAHDILEGEK